ncbi:SUD1 [Symbiodinium microadriaticum]|nr:SUD1 [Symbiodinium sp. KB8]CAE7486163.1 SUD1 [Symbiodinium microadriaticum]
MAEVLTTETPEGVGLGHSDQDDLEDEDEPCCRICRQGEEAGKLYCPCRCAGSIKWIHEECLQAWLRSKDGKTACELCGHSFDFVPVYSKNAPQRLTVSDWVGAFCSSSYRVGHRVLRVLYAVGLWGFLLPILTIMATRSIFGRQPRPAFGSAWHVLALTFDILIGECLSVAGIAFIYLLSFLTAVRSSLPADAASSQSEGAAPALVDVQLQPVAGEETTTDSHESTVSVGIQVDTRPRQEEVDPEEDLLNIMGLQGNPVRSLLSMLTFLCANVAGIYTFLGLPSYLGRWTLARVLPWIQAVAPDIVMLISWSSSDESSRSRGARSSVELPSAGVNVILDLLAFLFGYGVLACCMIVFVLGLLLVGAVTGCGQNSRSWQACRTLVVAARSHLCESILQTWQRIQRIAVALLQLVAFPAYVGHLVLCLLAGPVLHLSQQGRASLMSANPFITFVMQLFIGYVHLWGFAFMEGCVANVLMPDVVQRASLNFFVSAINCHRRLFGTMTEELGLSEATPLPPHWATLKLSLIHVAVHTPLVFAVWYLPAFLLDRLVGEALFPMLLVDQTGDVIEGLHRRDPFSLSGPVGVPARPSSKAKNGGMAEGQSLFVLELMQLYVLVLQCIRILETSPVMTRLISSGLRCWLRAIGFGHLLVGESPAPSQAQSEADWSNWVAKPWKFLGVSGLVVVICWSVMALVLALPLATGRLIVGLILSSQAKRFSDFLPLSMGVVVASAWILVTVKLGEALPRILEQASALRRHRCLHILACGFSAGAMLLTVTIVLPLGLGTLLLRLMLPLKVQSVFQVPIIFLLTDCWSLGLVLTKVIWRLVQSDVILHNLHREIEAVWEEAQGSLTHLFFNLRAHWRLWRMLVFPMLEAVVFHLVLPRTAVLTLLQFMEPGHEYLKAALLMYCYHIALTLRITLAAFPRMRLWLGEVRQQIFDSKYLISTELQNYHRIEDLSDSQEDAAGDSPGLPGTS